MKKDKESTNLFSQDTEEKAGETKMTVEANGATVQAEGKEKTVDDETETAREEKRTAEEPSNGETNTAEDSSDGESDTAEETEKTSEDETAGDTEENEDEKLLFRDTTPELVETAVHSLNSQGLTSVQYREEEETYAVYSSPEEFEKARELLIEILQDEAESISDRARTLEAKKRLREMEVTELAPGFRPDKTPREKYEDANSTAIAFLVVGAVGIAFVVLEFFGIFFSLNLSENVRYIFYPTMLVMFAAFLIVGFVNLNLAAKWKEKVFDEDRIMNNVREYAEHELIHEIRTMMAERVVNELNLEEAEASADGLPHPEEAKSRPAPEDALAQLESLFDGGFSGAEETDGTSALPLDESEETGDTAEVTGDESEETEEAEKEPEEVEETENSPEKAEDIAETAEEDRKEMDRAFNDYYVMEQEIQFRLLREFPDLPANLLVEATEYVIKLMEDDADEEEASEEEESLNDQEDTSEEGKKHNDEEENSGKG